MSQSAYLSFSIFDHSSHRIHAVSYITSDGRACSKVFNGPCQNPGLVMQKFFENCMNSDHLNHKDYNLVVLDEEDPTGLFGVASEMAKEEIFLDLKREYGDQGAIMVYNLHSSLGKFLRREVDLQCLTDSVSNLVNIM